MGIAGNRPHSRTCPICGDVFRTVSGGRQYCFKCSPPQIAGGAKRRDGMVSGSGLLEPHHVVLRRGKKNVFEGGRIDKDCIPSTERAVPDRLLDKAVKELQAAELKARARLPQQRTLDKAGDPAAVAMEKGDPDKPVGATDGYEGSGKKTDAESDARTRMLKNSGGDEVLAWRRPELGWGKCKHIDPKLKVETCDKERWSDASPFCKEHLQFWRDKREENLAKRIMDEEVSQFIDLDQKNFFFKNAQDVMDFLSRVNYAVYKNWIPVGKARALSNIARVQIKALDSKIIAHRLHAIISGLNKGQGGLAVTTPEELEEMEEDIENAKMMGIGDLARLVSDAMPQQQDKDIEFAPGSHPDLNPPDPEFPAHDLPPKAPGPNALPNDSVPPSPPPAPSAPGVPA